MKKNICFILLILFCVILTTSCTAESSNKTTSSGNMENVSLTSVRIPNFPNSKSVDADSAQKLLNFPNNLPIDVTEQHK